MKPTDQNYQDHPIFVELDYYINFYNTMAHSIFPFISVGTKARCNIDSYAFSSVRGTLTSIRLVLREGMIRDAYALTRQYYDSAIIIIYSNLYLDDNWSIDNFVVQQINDWIQGKDRLPKVQRMLQYIRDSQKVKPITKLLTYDNRYKKIRERCNDQTHYNYYECFHLNDPEVFLRNRHEVLTVLSCDLRDILILHISYLFYIRDHYMASSDYLDYLECGLTPEPDSQYWVATIVQEFFDDILKKYRPDIAAEILSNTSMHLR